MKLKTIGDVVWAAIPFILSALAVVGVVWVIRSCDPDARQHRAERELGSGASCDDSGAHSIIPCVLDGKAYQCIATEGRISCAQVDRL